jgi:hypothetical protein
MDGLDPEIPEPEIGDFWDGVEIECTLCEGEWEEDYPHSMTLSLKGRWITHNWREAGLKEYEAHVREKHPDKIGKPA